MKTTIRLLTTFLAFLCLSAVAPKAKAVVPPPDGGYPGFNTAEGTNALFSLTTGAANTAVGWYSLFSNTTGSFNTALGAGALLSNIGGPSEGVAAVENTAVGTAALLFNTMGAANTAVGSTALLNNNGSVNTAIGSRALNQNTSGSFNTAVGRDALLSNTSGQENTALGFAAMGSNASPNNLNTAVGSSALVSINNGASNTAVGAHALASLANSNASTAVGADALLATTGNANTALGANAGSAITTGSNIICIGTSGANIDNSCFIGRIYSTVQPIVGTDPDSVTIASNGRLGRGNVSSRRYKHDIKPMEKASEMVYALKPVSFRYHKEYDATQTLAFGLIAEEVAEVYPDLVGRNPKGEPESVRYEQINAMLLNEFLKEHRRVQQLEATVAALVGKVDEQAAELRKVTAQMQVNMSTRQVAANNH
jgi:Chaperone of endosialidase